MPYRSEKQRKFMHARHPGIAARWDREYGSKTRKPAAKKAAAERVAGKRKK